MPFPLSNIIINNQIDDFYYLFDVFTNYMDCMAPKSSDLLATNLNATNRENYNYKYQVSNYLIVESDEQLRTFAKFCIIQKKYLLR